MIHYSKGRVPRQAHVSIPQGLFEEQHGREGFAGRVTHFYRLHPQPNGPESRARCARAASIPTRWILPIGATPQGLPLRVFYNDEVTISISRRTEAMPYCFRNADGDDLHFIYPAVIATRHVLAIDPFIQSRLAR